MVTITMILVLLMTQGAIGSTVSAGQQKPTSASRIADTMQRNISFAGKQFVELADAMPADKYSYAPSDGEFYGARTFGQQVLHVANANFEISDAVLGNKPRTGANKLETKAELVAYLKASFEALERAAASLTAENATEQVTNPFGGGEAPYGGTPDRVGMLVMATAHSRDHYGQLALYLRMNGIVPPASRK
jgi:uncharacterized damage-inducible protein DinB